MKIYENVECLSAQLKSVMDFLERETKERPRSSMTAIFLSRPRNAQLSHSVQKNHCTEADFDQDVQYAKDYMYAIQFAESTKDKMLKAKEMVAYYEVVKKMRPLSPFIDGKDGVLDRIQHIFSEQTVEEKEVLRTLYVQICQKNAHWASVFHAYSGSGRPIFTDIESARAALRDESLGFAVVEIHVSPENVLELSTDGVKRTLLHKVFPENYKFLYEKVCGKMQCSTIAYVPEDKTYKIAPFAASEEDIILGKISLNNSGRSLS